MTDINVADLGKVAVLLGGRSGEREISIMSGRGVLQALLSRGVDAHAFDPAERPLQALADEGFARCFIALHGRYGEDGTVQGALELLGIPYTGAGVLASSLAIDKVASKRIWMSAGLATPPYVQLQRDSCSAADAAAVVEQLGLPLIVKPDREGSSLGITKVLQAGQMQAALDLAFQHDHSVLCEQMIVGDEVTCAVLGGGAQARALPLIHIVAPDGDYDYQNKYFTDKTEYRVPCDLPKGEEADIQDMVLKAYRTLGCRGWGRLDAMIDGQTRKPWLLELNTSPGMTSHSLVPMAARVAGLSYEALCLHLLADARLDYEDGGARQ